MDNVGKAERATQNRVIALFRDELSYRYLGDWTDREGNSNIEEGLITAYLTKCGYTPAQISVATYKLTVFFRKRPKPTWFHPGCLGIVPFDAYPHLHFFQPEMLFTATRRIQVFQR